MNTNDLPLLRETAQIVASHVSNNPIPAEKLPSFIRQIYETLTGLGGEAAPAVEITPSVPINKSVKEDYIICLEDGKKLKMLKRHLMTSYNMTPDQYRQKWGLPRDYPMVAPSYAETRSGLAKKSGLGLKRKMPAGRRRAVETTPEPQRMAAAEENTPPITRIPEGVSWKQKRKVGRPRKQQAA